MTRELEYLFYEEIERHTSIYPGKKRKSRGDFIKGKGQKDGVRLFLVMPSDIIRGNGHKLECRCFHVNVRKNLFPMRVAKPCSRLHRKVLKPPLETSLQNPPG